MRAASGDESEGFPSPLGEGRIETCFIAILNKIQHDSLHLWVRGGLKRFDWVY